MARPSILISILLLAIVALSSGFADASDYHASLAQGDCKSALPDLRELADRFPSDAGYYLALCLYKISPEKSRQEILTRLNKALAAGNERANYHLGIINLVTGNMATARSFIEKNQRTRLGQIAFDMLATPEVTSSEQVQKHIVKAISSGQGDIVTRLLEKANKISLMQWTLNPLDQAILYHQPVVARGILNHEIASSVFLNAESQFRLALLTGQQDVALLLLSALEPISAVDWQEFTLLAARHNQTQLFNNLLAQGTTVESPELARSPLAYLLDKNQRWFDELPSLRMQNKRSISFSWLTRESGAAGNPYSDWSLIELAAYRGDSLSLIREESGPAMMWENESAPNCPAERYYLAGDKETLHELLSGNDKTIPRDAFERLLTWTIENEDAWTLQLLLNQIPAGKLTEPYLSDSLMLLAVDQGIHLSWSLLLISRIS